MLFLLLLSFALRSTKLFVATLPIIYNSTFKDISLTQISPKFTKLPLDFRITFTLTRTLNYTELIGIRLPRFTQRLTDSPNNTVANISELIVSPSNLFMGQFLESTNSYDDFSVPYSNAMIVLKSKTNTTILKDTTISLIVFKENGIGASCGFASSIEITRGNDVFPSPPFQMFTMYPIIEEFNETVRIVNRTWNNDGILVKNITFLTSMLFNYTVFKQNDDVSDFKSYEGLGSGCDRLNRCSYRGQCDYCSEKCKCFDGFGSENDVLTIGATTAVDCSERVCPAGKAIADIAISPTVAHQLAECSNHGICERMNGTCQCFPPFTGVACERMSCPNNCSGHGLCLSMADLTRFHELRTKDASLTAYTSNANVSEIVYGSGRAFNSTAWDYGTMYGCYCESSWSVGINAGQRQLPEYFGPDCSFKRCPSGDDPFTAIDETNCYNKTQIPKGPRGAVGNLCHIDCSNRGICDYNTGKCTCFPGSAGLACNQYADSYKDQFRAEVPDTYVWNDNGTTVVFPLQY